MERSYSELNAKFIESDRTVFGTTTHKGKNIPVWNLYLYENIETEGRMVRRVLAM